MSWPPQSFLSVTKGEFAHKKKSIAVSSNHYSAFPPALPCFTPQQWESVPERDSSDGGWAPIINHCKAPRV